MIIFQEMRQEPLQPSASVALTSVSGFSRDCFCKYSQDCSSMRRNPTRDHRNLFQMDL